MISNIIGKLETLHEQHMNFPKIKEYITSAHTGQVTMIEQLSVFLHAQHMSFPKIKEYITSAHTGQVTMIEQLLVLLHEQHMSIPKIKEYITSRVHQIFEMQILNHHMPLPRERVEITKMNLKYFYSVSST